MLTSPKSISTKIVSRFARLLAGLALLLAGCDIVSQQVNKKEKQADEVTYEVTNDLAERLTVAPQDGSSSAKAAPAKSMNFTVRAQVTPPDVAPGSERASHLTPNFFGRKLYVGYMIRGDGPGNGFGGGVDILDISGALGSSLSNPVSIPDPLNALRVNGVDVQEITHNVEVLFLGVAEEESFDIGNTPSEVHSIDLDGFGLPVTSPGGTVDFDDYDLPGDLVKGVSRAADIDAPSDTDAGGHRFYAVTDANTFHRFAVDNTTGEIDFVTTDETTGFPGVEFRGLTATFAGGWAMDDGGNIWRGDPSGGLTREQTFPAPDFFDEDPTDDFGPLDTIARVTSSGGFPGGGLPFGPSLTCGAPPEPVLFAALNNDGFRVISTGGPGPPVETFRNSSLEVTSVAIERGVTTGLPFVYVASGREIALFEVEPGICDPTDTDAGLRKIGKARISSFDDAGPFDFSNRGQINEIFAIEDPRPDGGDALLYIAKGDDGVFVVEQGNTGYP